MTTEATPGNVPLSDQLGHADEVQPLWGRLRHGYTDWNGDRMARGAPPMDCLTAGDVIDAVDEIERLRGLYEELLYAVGNKHQGETRHQTALRYIQQAEAPCISAAKCAGPNDLAQRRP